MIEFYEQFLELILAYNSKSQVRLLSKAGTIDFFTVKIKVTISTLMYFRAVFILVKC